MPVSLPDGLHVAKALVFGALTTSKLQRETTGAVGLTTGTLPSFSQPHSWAVVGFAFMNEHNLAGRRAGETRLSSAAAAECSGPRAACPVLLGLWLQPAAVLEGDQED